MSAHAASCLLYTSDAADEEDSVDLGGRRIIKKKTHMGQARPAGRNSWIGRSYHASAPCSAKTAAVRSASSVVRTASPHVTQSTAGIGTPQDRWREMHQSGRLASISVSRSSPHAGIHLTCRTASIAFSRRPVLSIATNHWLSLIHISEPTRLLSI